MNREADHIKRRTWAPFVGAALAALTAGSLVVFSLVAQRTSLDGFPELRIAAPAEPTSGEPASITVAPLGVSDGSREVASSDAPASDEVAEVTEPTTPLALIPLVPATVPPAPVELAVVDNSAGAPITAARSRQPRSGERANFDGRFRADGTLLAARRDGGTSGDDARAGESKDLRRGGKHAHKSRDDKSKKNRKHKSSKNHGATHRRSRGRAHGHGPQDASHAASASNGSQGKSHQSAAPRPQPSPQGPPAHSNAGGNGKSNGKGKKH